MTKIYMIAKSKNWADEFDYPILSIFTEKTKNVILLHNNFFDDTDLEECYFGTNEYFSFKKEKVLAMIRGAEEVNGEDLKVAYKIRSKFEHCSYDIIDNILESMYSNACDVNNEEMQKILEELQ